MGMLPKLEEVCRKYSFYDEVKCERDMHSADDLVMCFGDFDGHIGWHFVGFNEVCGCYGIGHRNLEGRKF